MWSSLGAAPNGEGAGLLPTPSRLALGGLSVWLLVQVRLKQCDTKTEAGSGHGSVWTRRLDAAPGHSRPRLGAHGPCAAGGGRGSGQVSRPRKPPGLSCSLTTLVPGSPVPSPGLPRGEVGSLLHCGGGRQWGCTLRGGGSRPSVPRSGVWAEFRPHPRTDARLTAAHQP